MVAFTSGGPIDETNARAAAEFVEFAREDGGVDAAEPGDDSAAASPLDGAAGELLPEIAARQTNPAAGAATDVPESAAGEPGAERGDDAGSDRAAPADDAAATEPAGSTLVLLDTSEGMDLDAVRGALTPLLDRAIDGEGRRVALWNYSSPMSRAYQPGASQRPFRRGRRGPVGGGAGATRHRRRAMDGVRRASGRPVAGRIRRRRRAWYTGADATGVMPVPQSTASPRPRMTARCASTWSSSARTPRAATRCPGPATAARSASPARSAAALVAAMGL